MKHKSRRERMEEVRARLRNLVTKYPCLRCQRKTGTTSIKRRLCTSCCKVRKLGVVVNPFVEVVEFQVDGKMLRRLIDERAMSIAGTEQACGFGKSRLGRVMKEDGTITKEQSSSLIEVFGVSAFAFMRTKKFVQVDGDKLFQCRIALGVGREAFGEVSTLGGRVLGQTLERPGLHRVTPWAFEHLKSTLALLSLVTTEG